MTRSSPRLRGQLFIQGWSHMAGLRDSISIPHGVRLTQP
jgi:hypothetical protein